MKKGFTIIELLVSMGLFAAVIAAAGMVFHYSIESQRTAAATAEIMRTLRAVTDQLNIDFQGLRSDGFLILYSEQKNPPADTNNYDALYYFSTGDYQSWSPAGIRSNIARIFLGHSQLTYNNTLPGDFARDVLLLATTHTRAGNDDCANISFEECQASLNSTALFILLQEPANVLTTGRPDARANNFRSLFSQNVGSFKIEWTYGWVHSAAQDRMVWWGIDTTLSLSDANDLRSDGGLEEFGTPVVSIPNGDLILIANAIYETENTGSPHTYMVEWNPNNQQYWPKALKFTFTLYDSKRILKGGRTFEHIVYIDK